MAELKPLREGWELTAATASQISDGAAALLIASEDAVERHGLTPRARIHALTVTGADPVFMLTGPIPATEQALARAAPRASPTSTCSRSTRRSRRCCSPGRRRPAPRWRRPTRTAARSRSGHPLGATGAILMTKLLHELERTGGRYGLQTMCEGGGQANATIIERLS